MKETRKVGTLFIRGEKEDFVRDPIIIIARWGGYFHPLVYVVFDKLNADIASGVSQRSVEKALGTELVETQMGDTLSQWQMQK